LQGKNSFRRFYYHKKLSLALNYVLEGILFFYEVKRRKASFEKLTTVKKCFLP